MINCSEDFLLGFDCLLQIKENLCGTCTSLGGGAFRLESNDGLRFGGKSFDDNRIGKGSMQVRT